MGRVKDNALTPKTDKGRNLGESGRSFGRLYVEDMVLNGKEVSTEEGAMSPTSVIADSAEDYEAITQRNGDIIKTTIFISLKGLKSTATTNDIIGDTGASHIGRVTTAVNGVIYKGQVSCSVVPTTGDDDIDIYAATADDGAFDDAATGLTGQAVLVTSGGAYAIGTVKPFTALPAADAYLYLATGDTTAGTYGAGKIIIEMWGKAA